jgi:hypothetical protein
MKIYPSTLSARISACFHSSKRKSPGCADMFSFRHPYLIVQVRRVCILRQTLSWCDELIVRQVTQISCAGKQLVAVPDSILLYH